MQKLEHTDELTAICIDTLVSGHVTSFTEFFVLVVKESVIPRTSVEKLRAFQNLLRASENGKRSSNSKNVYNALTNLANFFVESGQYDMSIKYMERALEVSKSLSTSVSEFEAYMNYGRALQQVNRLYDALNCFENAKMVSETMDSNEHELLAAKGIITVRIKIAQNVYNLCCLL